jgi:hypothetical protein
MKRIKADPPVWPAEKGMKAKIQAPGVIYSTNPRRNATIEYGREMKREHLFPHH